MRKTDKKLEKGIIDALTQVCEQAQEAFDGFLWLTHEVNFNDVSRSLKVTCVFETRAQVTGFLGRLSNSPNRAQLSQMIQHQLKPLGIQLKDSFKQIKLDSEEACLDENAGNWKQRLS